MYYKTDKTFNPKIKKLGQQKMDFRTLTLKAQQVTLILMIRHANTRLLSYTRLLSSGECTLRNHHLEITYHQPVTGSIFHYPSLRTGLTPC